MNVDKVGVISVEKGRLPFRSTIKTTRIPKFENSPDIKTSAQISAARYSWLQNVIRKAKTKAIVIDDSQYLLADEFFDRAKETGYQKFTDMALNFRNLIHYIYREMPDDVIVYFLHHTEIDDGKVTAKTIGKMLKEKLTVEGCFDIVLMADSDGADHYFLTQSDGYTTCKSPEEMFEDLKIPNDLKFVDDKIREYYQS